jgi:hypothetical protein
MISDLLAIQICFVNNFVLVSSHIFEENNEIDLKNQIWEEKRFFTFERKLINLDISSSNLKCKNQVFFSTIDFQYSLIEILWMQRGGLSARV